MDVDLNGVVRMRSTSRYSYINTPVDHLCAKMHTPAYPEGSDHSILMGCTVPFSSAATFSAVLGLDSTVL